MAQTAQKLNDLITSICEKVLDKKIKENKIMSRMAVTVASYDSTNMVATIIIPGNDNIATVYAYPNRVGRDLVVGEKVYLIYQANNISQGWLETNEPLIASSGGATVSVSGNTLVIVNQS